MQRHDSASGLVWSGGVPGCLPALLALAISPPALSRPAPPHQVLAPLRVSSLRIDGSVDAAERFRRWVERARCACCQAVHALHRRVVSRCCSAGLLSAHTAECADHPTCP